MNYTLTGTGCGGSSVEVTSFPNVMFLKKRQVNETSTEGTSTSTTEVTATVTTPTEGSSTTVLETKTTSEPANVTQFITQNITVIVASPVHSISPGANNIALENTTMYHNPLKNISVHFDRPRYSAMKRDIYEWPSGNIMHDPAIFKGLTHGTTYLGPSDEVYASCDGDTTWRICLDSTGDMVGQYFTANYSGVGGPLLWFNIFPAGCGVPGEAQPVKVVFDHEAGRFVIALLAGNLHMNFCVAVSQTNNPNGGWYVYTFNDASAFGNQE
jgi:hypothetical protein